MKKAIIAVVIIGFFTFAYLAFAKSEPNGDPFQAIWNAISDVKQQIANIQLIPGPKGDKGDRGETGPVGELEPGFISAPAFDSGWIDLPNGANMITDVPHNVGGDPNDYFIYTSFKKWDNSLTSYKSEPDFVYLRNIESNNLQIFSTGVVRNVYNAIRIRIWKINQ